MQYRVIGKERACETSYKTRLCFRALSNIIENKLIMLSLLRCAMLYIRISLMYPASTVTVVKKIKKIKNKATKKYTSAITQSQLTLP